MALPLDSGFPRPAGAEISLNACAPEKNRAQRNKCGKTRALPRQKIHRTAGIARWDAVHVARML